MRRPRYKINVISYFSIDYELGVVQIPEIDLSAPQLYVFNRITSAIRGQK